MHQPRRRKLGLRAYLKQSGLLEHGSPKDIAKAKREYRSNYHREYKRERRARFPEVTVTLVRSEFSKLSKAAKAHKMSLPAFLRESSLHYLDQKFLVPNSSLVSHFAQQLRICASDINLMTRHVKKLNMKELHQTYQSLSHRIQQIESFVVNAFRNPPRQ